MCALEKIDRYEKLFEAARKTEGGGNFSQILEQEVVEVKKVEIWKMVKSYEPTTFDEVFDLDLLITNTIMQCFVQILNSWYKILKRMKYFR